MLRSDTWPVWSCLDGLFYGIYKACMDIYGMYGFAELCRVQIEGDALDSMKTIDRPQQFKFAADGRQTFG